jgi:hypothetical protein
MSGCKFVGRFLEDSQNTYATAGGIPVAVQVDRGVVTPAEEENIVGSLVVMIAGLFGSADGSKGSLRKRLNFSVLSVSENVG